MTTLTNPDLDLLHDLEWVPACQFENCFSGHPPATHTVTLLPCGCCRVACQECAAELDEIGNQILAEPPLRDCIVCKVLLIALLVKPLP